MTSRPKNLKSLAGAAPKFRIYSLKL